MKYIRKLVSLFLCLLSIVTFISCSKNDSNSAIVQPHRLEWWLEDIGWEDNRTDLTGKNVKIAVIDSGVDIEHNDIKDSIEKNIKVSQLDETSMDNNSHGTAVAAVITGKSINDNGVLGIATDSKIVSIDVTDDPEGIVDENDLIEGITIAIDERVDIINISMGIENDSSRLHGIIKEAFNAGIIIVAAAGNFMESKLLYPAAYNEVICVGSKSKKGEIISPKKITDKSIIYLPGEYISSAAKGNTYNSFSGTSISTPILTGIISLMLENDPNASSKDIYDYFSKTSKNIKVKNCINFKRSIYNE